MADIEQFDYRKELKLILAERQTRNASYSIRAMARDLSVSPTALHGVLSGTRHFSKKGLESLAFKLGWSQYKLDEALGITKTLEDKTEILLDEDRFSMISDWMHLAILNLVRIPGTKRETISDRLGLEKEVCDKVIERLVRLGFLEIKEGKLIRLEPSFGTKQNTQSLALQAFHYKNLKKAQEALDKVSGELRDFLTIVVPTNIKQVNKVKLMIREFRKEVMQVLEDSDPEEVYFLNIQLYPVTQSLEAKIPAAKLNSEERTC